MKVIVHVQITRVTSIYHSYFSLCNIFWEKPIYKFPGEYCLNVGKQLQYKSSACIFNFFFYFKLNAFGFFNLYVFNYCFLCGIDACDVTLVTFIIRISRSYVIFVGAADWKEPNDVTVLAYQEEIIMLNFDNKP